MLSVFESPSRFIREYSYVFDPPPCGIESAYTNLGQQTDSPRLVVVIVARWRRSDEVRCQLHLFNISHSEFRLSAIQKVSSPLTLSVAASAAKSKRRTNWHPSTSLRYAQDERLETACCTGYN
jgi:hypothetical protein